MRISLIILGALALGNTGVKAGEAFDPKDRESVETYLRSLVPRDEQEVRELVVALSSDDFKTRQEALRELTSLASSMGNLLEKLHEESEEPEVKKGLARALADREALPSLGIGALAADVLKYGHRGLAAKLVPTAGLAANQTEIDTLVAAARLSAGESERARLVEMLESDLSSVRGVAARVLPALGGDALKNLRPLLEDDTPLVKLAAAQAFAAASDPACIPALGELAASEDFYSRWQASELLRQITSGEIDIDPLSSPEAVDLEKWIGAKGWKAAGGLKPIKWISRGRTFDDWKRGRKNLHDETPVEHREEFQRFPVTAYCVWGSPLRFQNYRLRIDWRYPGGEWNANGGLSLVKFEGELPDRFNPWDGGGALEIEIKQENTGSLYPHGTKIEVDGKPIQGGSLQKRLPPNQDPKGWNTLEVEERDGRIRIFVNGILQNEASGCSPELSAFGIRCERCPIDVRNLTIEPLPGAKMSRGPFPVKPPTVEGGDAP